MTTISRVGRWCAAITVTEVLAFLDMTNGAHAREDFPDRDDQNWLKHTLSSLDENGNVTFEYRPVHMYTLTDEVEVVPLKKRVY